MKFQTYEDWSPWTPRKFWVGAHRLRVFFVFFWVFARIEVNI